MADLLLHSMAEFADIILPVLELAAARDVVEVGSEYGTMTRELLDHANRHDGRLTVVDPNPSPDAEALFDGNPRGVMVKKLSLEALGDLDADAWLIDGDHNYHTVRHESELIWERTQAAKRPFLVFYHDVGWPWGRRDLYYDPETVPETARRPHTWEHGVILGDPGVVPGGFRGEGGWACALTEGGPRNGVLTAIEDFVEGRETDLVWACVPAVFGLGILFDSRARWTEAVKRFLLPYHLNPLLERLERNRLDCYLRVIAMQDEAHERCA